MNFKQNPTTRAAGGVLEDDRQLGALINSQNSLCELRSQYLAETFGLPADTALVVAELAFGEGGAR